MRNDVKNIAQYFKTEYMKIAKLQDVNNRIKFVLLFLAAALAACSSRQYVLLLVVELLSEFELFWVTKSSLNSHGTPQGKIKVDWQFR